MSSPSGRVQYQYSVTLIAVPARKQFTEEVLPAYFTTAFKVVENCAKSGEGTRTYLLGYIPYGHKWRTAEEARINNSNLELILVSPEELLKQGN